jgi:hypothetical protein
MTMEAKVEVCYDDQPNDVADRFIAAIEKLTEIKVHITSDGDNSSVFYTLSA